MVPTDRDTPHSLLLRLAREERDDPAWNTFIQRYQPHILAWCRERGLQPADADDVAQTILSQLLTTMREFRYDPSGSFRAWLRTVTTRACGRFMLRENRSAGLKDEQALRRIEEMPARQDLARRIEEIFDSEQLRQAMDTVREAVEPHTWEAFRLTAIQQLSAAEVGPRVGMPVMHVYVARQRVQRMLQREVERLQRFVEGHQQ